MEKAVDTRNDGYVRNKPSAGIFLSSRAMMDGHLGSCALQRVVAMCQDGPCFSLHIEWFCFHSLPSPHHRP